MEGDRLMSISRASGARATRRVAALALAGAAVLAVLVPAGSARQQAVPANTTQPTITGTPAQGQTLTATQGTWAGDPTSYAYQWVRCPSSGGAPDGSDCAVIGGASTTAYVVSSGDVGSRLRVRVTASGAEAPRRRHRTPALIAAQVRPPALCAAIGSPWWADRPASNGA
jgi:hypothetical protein